MRLTTDSLTKRYGDFELSIPDLDIKPGTALGLVGNNGAGKTTFLRLVLDLIRADDGQVHLDGAPVADSFDWKTRTGSYLGPSFLIDFLTPDEYWHFAGRTTTSRSSRGGFSIEKLMGWTVHHASPNLPVNVTARPSLDDQFRKIGSGPSSKC